MQLHIADAAQIELDSNPKHRYDVVTAFECIHDLGNPVEVLGSMRRLVTDDGVVLVMDERVGVQQILQDPGR